MTIEEKIAELERLCPGCSFLVDRLVEGDPIIRIVEFGRRFHVRREWADLEGDWPECWFDHEIAKRPEPQDVTNEVVMKAAGHDYNCDCGLCEVWWKAVGPDPDTGRCGPWTMEELGLDLGDWEEDGDASEILEE